ncbi:MAG: glycosyltransferase family 4 protein [Mycobacteriaceae bacterium]
MRIVHVADSFAPDVGGIESQVQSLAQAQQRAGHDVSVITAVHAHAELGFPVARARRGRWLTVAFPWVNRKMVGEVLDAGPDDPPVDIVHAHLSVVSPLGVYVVRAATRRNIPVAVTVHSLWWKVTPAAWATFVPFGWGRIRAAWSAVSTVAAARVRRVLPLVAEVTTLANLIDVDWWRPAEPPREDDHDAPRLIVVGRLKKRKHVDEFLDILARARARVPDQTRAEVSIVGSGPRHDDLQQQINDLGLGDWVTLLGHRTSFEVRALLHTSDLFVAPSRQEAFGIAAFEARAAGLPVLGYGGTGLADFIVDGRDGLLPADGVAMVEVLTTLLTAPDELGRLRRHTSTTAPPIAVADTMAAVDELYRRARAMHQR